MAEFEDDARSSVLRMICGSRLLMAPPGGGFKIHRPGEMAKLADPRNVVASGCGRRGSRGLFCPVGRARHLVGEPRRPKLLEALPATRLRATSLHRVAEQAGGRFTQDRTPTCSRA